MVAEAQKKGNAGNLKVHRDAKKSASRCTLAYQKTPAEWHYVIKMYLIENWVFAWLL